MTALIHFQEAYPGLRYLFMLGYAAKVIAHQGVLDAEVQCILKPFSMKALSGKVREVLGGD